MSLLQSHHNNDKIEEEIIKIISLEVKQDGGATLVRDLKDYNCRIETMLKRYDGTKKLLSFLEQFPNIFEVHRNSLPHIVYLVAYNDHYNQDSMKRLEEVDPVFHKRLDKAKDNLDDKIIHILRKERNRNSKRMKLETRDESVSMFWLLKQCKSQLHFYLRLSSYYFNVYSNCKDVQIVGSDMWCENVTPQFVKYLKECSYCDLQNDRVILKEDNNYMNDEDNIRVIAKALKDKVEEDGGTHISLSLLLHRHHDLCRLLSGYDLITMKNEHQSMFQDIKIYSKNGEVYLQCTSSKIGRMLVDETGLFSVASSKWGTAFSSIMAYHCCKHLSTEPVETVAVDLTASVGGCTLPLAKTFKKVVAVEIDQHRANLCRQNMENFDVSEKVDILNNDSVKIIPDIARNIKNQPRIIVLDPPWGGKYYKQEKREILMGSWSMDKVLKRIAEYLSPTIVGLRMPVTFDVDMFNESLKNVHIDFKVLEVKKAGPQLFITLLIN